MEGILQTFTREELAFDCPVDDVIARRVRNSYYPDRCGEVTWVLEPYCLMDTFLTGTNHGSPHSYDTHVPLLFFGTGIKPGIRNEAAAPQSIAATFAKAAGIKPPKKAIYPMPQGLFVK